MASLMQKVPVASAYGLQTGFSLAEKSRCSELIVVPRGPRSTPSCSDICTARNLARPHHKSQHCHRKSKHKLRAAATQGVVLERAEQTLKGSVEYDWRRQWYPVHLSRDVLGDKPIPISVFDLALVLWRDADSVLHCVDDRCPHRAAKLSEGQITEGRLECLYHGWQFEGSGECSLIPQLAEGGSIPRAACMTPYPVIEHQGIVYVWPSNREKISAKVPTWEGLQEEGWVGGMFMSDLPYDHSYLIENLLDPCHIPVSHDKTTGGGKKENAQALAMEIIRAANPEGFVGRYHNTKGKMNEVAWEYSFEAPCSIRVSADFGTEKDGSRKLFRAALLCTPLGLGRSRLFFVTWRNFLRWYRPPRWYEHLSGSVILEQDMGLIASQEATVRRSQEPLSKLYLPLDSADLFVIEYRKWLDLVGHGMPYYEGHRYFANPHTPAVQHSAPAGLPGAVAASTPPMGNGGGIHLMDTTNRYMRHVVHCEDCMKAMRAFERVRSAALFAAIGGSLSALALPDGIERVEAAAIAGVALGIGWVMQKGVEKFRTNFVREHKR